MFDYCVKVKKETKKGQSLIARSENFIGDELSDVYKTCSLAKKQVYYQCKRLCEREGGYGFRIISKNNNFFSVAWNVIVEQTLVIRIETAFNSYVVM